MVYIYLNYPNPHATLHGDATCGFIPPPPTEGQRWVCITRETFAEQVGPFEREEIVFRAEAKLNDMWLAIDMGDRILNRAIGEYLLRLLGRRYAPFRGMVIKEHC